MHKAQRQVMEFHRETLQRIADGTGLPKIRRGELRAKLIEEEAAETCRALREGNLIEAIDGLCDILVVTYGCAVEMAIDLEPFFEEVHKTNLAKADGPVREDGKQLKPEGWEPPNLERVLKEHYES